MKMRVVFTTCLLVTLVYATPTIFSNNPAVHELYTAEYDIVQILFPVNNLNNMSYLNGNQDTINFKPMIFFILADTTHEPISYKGVYVHKNSEVTKLLDNGKDVTAANDDSKTVYIAASDGIYFYNAEENKAEKYGTITDDIIGIAKVNGSDVLYILNADHEVYKVTDAGTKKKKIPEVDNAQRIVLDYKNNLYYLSNNSVYVFGSNGTKKMEGLLKTNSNNTMPLKSPIVVKDAIPVIVDDKMHIVYGNATVLPGFLETPEGLTAFSCEGSLFLYFGVNKKIYEMNVMVLIDRVFSSFRKALTDMLKFK